MRDTGKTLQQIKDQIDAYRRGAADQLTRAQYALSAGDFVLAQGQGLHNAEFNRRIEAQKKKTKQ